MSTGKPPKRLCRQEGYALGKAGHMRYIFRLVLMLIILAAIAVVAYSFIGDLTAQRTTVETPVTLEVN